MSTAPKFVSLSGLSQDRHAAKAAAYDFVLATGTQDEVFAAIAAKHLRIETLEERKSDRLDFHEVSVWGVKAALEAAYAAGKAAK